MMAQPMYFFLYYLVGATAAHLLSYPPLPAVCALTRVLDMSVSAGPGKGRHVAVAVRRGSTCYCQVVGRIILLGGFGGPGKERHVAVVMAPMAPLLPS